MSSKTLRTIGTRPIRMWIDGKCFDVKQRKKKSLKTTHRASPEPKGESSLAETLEENSSSKSLSLVEIMKDDNGKHSTSFELPPIYYIRMNQASVLDVIALSKETNTDIIIPKNGKGGKLIITGEDENGVRRALEEIHCTVGYLRDQAPPIQFIAIPLLSGEIQENFEKFKAAVLSEKDDVKGLDASIFQKSNKLHLTVLVCVLQDNKEKNEAIAALKDYKDNILGPLIEKNGSITIHVSGVECMTDDYKKAKVIYANAKIIEESEEFNLQKIANDLSDFFYERGLMKRYQENVKLHMTLINTKYRKVPNSPRRFNKRQSIDATKIIEKYKDYHFGTCKLDNIRLSVMHTEGADGFYNSLSFIEV